MVELRRYASKINEVNGIKDDSGKNSTDEIIEKHWLEIVVEELNKMSLDCAKDLEMETGRYPKPGWPDGQPLEKAPPTRLLALTLVLCYWLGWVNNEKYMDAQPFKA
jgi:hypothetical protein